MGITRITVVLPEAIASISSICSNVVMRRVYLQGAGGGRQCQVARQSDQKKHWLLNNYYITILVIIVGEGWETKRTNKTHINKYKQQNGQGGRNEKVHRKAGQSETCQGTRLAAPNAILRQPQAVHRFQIVWLRIWRFMDMDMDMLSNAIKLYLFFTHSNMSEPFWAYEGPWGSRMPVDHVRGTRPSHRRPYLSLLGPQRWQLHCQPVAWPAWPASCSLAHGAPSSTYDGKSHSVHM